jgi:hypothetical protein
MISEKSTTFSYSRIELSVFVKIRAIFFKSLFSKQELTPVAKVLRQNIYSFFSPLNVISENQK